MEDCTLGHIPPRLKTGERKAFQTFEVGEKLFRRCTPEQLENPFAYVKLYDLSLNREGLKAQKISEANDVLYNVNPDIDQEIHDRQICILEIISLNESGTYQQKLEDDIKGIFAIIYLLHDPVPCMYPHTVFQIFAGEVEVTEDNYSATIGSKAYKTLKQKIRQVLGIMIVREEVDQNQVG